MKSKFYNFDILNSLPTETLIAVIVAFFLLHVGILVCIGFFKKQIHPMYFMLLVISTMFYASPFDTVTVSEAGRWFRVYLLVLTALIGLVLYFPKRLGPPAKFALLYAAFTVVNAAKTFDAAALIGVIYKLIFLLSLVACISMAHSVRDPKKLFKQFHWFVGLMVVYAVNYIVYMAMHSSMLVNARFYYGNVRTMLLAVSVGSVAVICVFVALYDTSKKWRIISAFVAITMTLLVLLSGSRGPTLALTLSCFCMVLPMVKRPGLLVTCVLVVGIGAAIIVASGMETSQIERAFGVVDISQGSSLAEASNNRFEIWRSSMSGFYENPVLGCGFIETGLKNATGGLSSYVQLFVEGGLIGTALFLLFLFVTLYCLVRVLIKGRNSPEVGGLRMLPVGAFVFTGFVGITESTLLYGTNLNAILLMLAIGYLDWMYLAIKSPQPVQQTILVRRERIGKLPSGATS